MVNLITDYLLLVVMLSFMLMMSRNSKKLELRTDGILLRKIKLGMMVLSWTSYLYQASTCLLQLVLMHKFAYGL